MTKTQKLITSIVIIAILFGGYIFFDKRSKNEQNTVAGTETNSTTTTTSSGTKITTSGNGGYTIEQVPLSEGTGVPQPIPDLNRQVTPPGSATVSSEAKVLATQKIPPLQAELKKTPSSFNTWLELAMYQKMAGDYQGAVISWTYASKLAPGDFISLGNLGNLYAYFLNDKVKAEAYYKKAIVNGPTQENLYTQLAETYRDIFHDNVKAKAVVEQGLVKLPNNVNLLRLKASL